ncbi:MAG TPA: DUF924 family protein [Caulobacteraceae bacterium]|jgi:uncharacterized protein (DUF924 family)|nr:DUF924 family protein [Caulobacteraceae bacterium]
MSIEPPLYVEILEFWRTAGPKAWFKADPAFDADIRARYEPAHFAAARGELADWADMAEGALALLLLTDQFARNLFRGSAHAFATDPMARAVADRAVRADFHLEFEPGLRPFFFLPFEHSESLADQDRSVALHLAHEQATGDANSLKWARLHRDIIKRFGRFPHRNAALGRQTTPQEAEFLANGGFAG